jgi:multiple sugar transport system substrate-binding protein
MRRFGLLCLLCISFPGCSGRESDARITLNLWAAPTGGDEKAFRVLCDRFEKDHLSIRLHVVGGLKEEKLVRAIVAGAPPDLAYLYNPVMAGPLAANHAVLPLDAYYRQSGFRDQDFLPAAIDQMRWRGTLYAMPVTRDSRGFYWNKRVFREAGLNPDLPPATLEEMFELAVRFTKRRPDGRLSRLGVLPPRDNALFFCAMGGRLYEPATNRVTIDCPENLAALKWRVKLVDAEGGRDAVAAFASGFGPTESAQNPLAKGDVAMQIDGEWLAVHLERYAPDADYGIGEIPHPAARPDVANMAWQDGDIMVIPAGAAHSDAAWEFMRWLQEPRQQELYATLMNNLPTVRTLVNSPRITSGSRSRETLGYILRHIAANKSNARYFPALPVTKLYRDALDYAVEMAELHRKTPKAALADAQVRVQRELDRYR